MWNISIYRTPKIGRLYTNQPQFFFRLKAYMHTKEFPNINLIFFYGQWTPITTNPLSFTPNNNQLCPPATQPFSLVARVITSNLFDIN